jgi:DNA-binding LacI/PurR family transcriptional regulator
MAASTSRERLAGFRTALEEANLPLPPQRILEGAFDANFGYAATRRLLEEQPEVDGLFVANDPIAVGVARALGELGRRMPICSYDEPALELGTDPAIVQSIIHLKQQRYALGHAAAEVLVRRVHEQAAGQVPPMPPARIRIKAELNEPARPVSGRVGRAAKEPQSTLREQRGQQTLQPLSSG